MLWKFGKLQYPVDKIAHIRGVLAAILGYEMGDLVWPGTQFLPISPLHCPSNHKVTTLPGENRTEYRNTSS